MDICAFGYLIDWMRESADWMSDRWMRESADWMSDRWMRELMELAERLDE